MSDRIDELVDTPEQALRYLDTVMCSDNEDLRRGAYNRVSIHIKQLATIAREADKWRKAAEWLARSAVSCLGTRDCDVFFDEDNPDMERICDECRQNQLDRALAAVEQEEIK